MTAFDLLGPLPSGTTVLEASAGTGKTYAIVGLATRYVAEGHADISELLLVTLGQQRRSCVNAHATGSPKWRRRSGPSTPRTRRIR